MIIKSLWAAQPGRFFCVSTKSRAGQWRDEFFSRRELNAVRDYIRGNENKDLYFCPHGFRDKRRHKSVAVAPKLLYADLDEVDPRKIRWKPTIAIESSPGRYVGIWLVDKEITEDLNRRLTYALEADKGGWDFSQVLRIPGTTNYKYNSMLKVRLLWDDGPTYKVAQLERELPAKSKSSGGSVKDIWKRYEGKLPRWVRRELLHGKPTVGKRSEVLWKIEHALV